MKHRMIAMTIFLVLAPGSHAQTARGLGIYGGLVMANQNWHSPNLQPTWKNRPGFTFGVFSELAAGRTVALVAELSYAQKGMQEKQPVTNADSPYPSGEFIIHDNRLDYLSLNLLGKFRVGTKNIAPYFCTGPRVDILLTKNVSPIFAETYAEWRNTAFGLSAGVGTEVRGSLPFSVLVEIRYDYDLTKSLVVETLSITNRILGARIGVKF